MNNEKYKAEWISVKDRLPEHHSIVLTFAKNRYIVCCFLQLDKVKEVIKEHGIPVDEEALEDDYSLPYAFCSQELPGATLKWVTHWMPLPSPPKSECH